MNRNFLDVDIANFLRSSGIAYEVLLESQLEMQLNREMIGKQTSTNKEITGIKNGKRTATFVPLLSDRSACIN